MITDTNDIEDIFHHINMYAPEISVFNFFREAPPNNDLLG